MRVLGTWFPTLQERHTKLAPLDPEDPELEVPPYYSANGTLSAMIGAQWLTNQIEVTLGTTVRIEQNDHAGLVSTYSAAASGSDTFDLRSGNPTMHEILDDVAAGTDHRIGTVIELDCPLSGTFTVYQTNAEIEGDGDTEEWTDVSLHLRIDFGGIPSGGGIERRIQEYVPGRFVFDMLVYASLSGSRTFRDADNNITGTSTFSDRPVFQSLASEGDVVGNCTFLGFATAIESPFAGVYVDEVTTLTIERSQTATT